MAIRWERASDRLDYKDLTLQSAAPDPPPLITLETKTVAGLDDLTWGSSTYNDEPITDFHVEISTVGVDIGATVFTGAGLDDATSGGTYTAGDNVHTYTVIIDATGTPDTFKWKKDAGSFTTGVAITGAAQTLTDGVQITFAATTGHTLTDQWVISTANPDKFDWLQDGGGGATDVAITAAAQTLADAVTITFAAKRHHTLADEWNISITPQIRLYGDDAGVLKYINSNGTVT